MRFSSSHALDSFIDYALQDSQECGEWATNLCVDPDREECLKIILMEDSIVAGLSVAAKVFSRVDKNLRVAFHTEDGATLGEGSTLLEVSGSLRSLLKAHGLANNLLQRMCSIATKTMEFVRGIDSYSSQIITPRLQSPCLKRLDLLSSIIGGAISRPYFMNKGVFLDKYHINSVGSLTLAINKMIESLAPTSKIEVEVFGLDESYQAQEAGADLIILRDLSLAELALAVRSLRGRSLIEVSGYYTVEDVVKIAECGVNFISSFLIFEKFRLISTHLKFSNFLVNTSNIGEVNY